MLIIALVLAVIGLAALVTAVVTSNELIAWVCIGASVIGVLLLIVDALRERSRGTGDEDSEESDDSVGESTAFVQPEPAEDYPEEHEPHGSADADTTAVVAEEHDVHEHDPDEHGVDEYGVDQHDLDEQGVDEHEDEDETSRTKAE